ncbi:MAG TPA: hypothetical protein VLG11_05190 [Candidatus Saccharimonadales bacterium]|nr:hypothetical protein [Candidatus Saccharimonadales bacterium]
MSNPESSRTSQAVAEGPVSDSERPAASSRGRRVGRTAGALLLTALTATGCAAVFEGSPAPASSSASSTPEKPTVAEPTPTTTTNPPATSQVPIISGKTYTEVEQANNVTKYRDFKNLIGTNGTIPHGQSVEVSCIEYDPAAPATSTAGLWYELADGSGYAASNTFYNQPDVGGPEQNNAYDPQVPKCVDSPALPPVHGTHG